MRFDSNLAWKDAASAVSANRDVLLALAGVFFVLPSFAFALLYPQPEPPAGAAPEQLFELMGAFTPNAERIQFRETRSLANRGYWVFLPAQGSRDKALSIARELSAKGLRDYYVVTAGERENTISLGLFRDLSNAEQRHEQVRQAGFAPQLQPLNAPVVSFS